ncbi:DUF1254 domain-containing protein [Nocardia tengchongensis]|uniref:DUF1254 domain-containing protein n=1 Tax=Nocardia tengchongensis TaxID=2055889 RepID=UPI00368F414A
MLKKSGSRRRWSAIITMTALVVTLPACSGSKESDGKNANDKSVSTAEIRDIAKQAYVYGYPMVDNYRIQYSYFQDEQSSQYRSPWNVLHSDAHVATPADTAVQTPNSDTPYTTLGADLRAEPLVLTVPEVESNRYYSVQFIDAYTYNMAYVGSRTTGNKAGKYLLAGPDWKGEKPAGVDQVLRSETDFVLALYRTQLFGPDDIDNVKAIQAGYKAEPLSKFLGKSAPAAAATIDFVVPQNPQDQRKSTQFFNTLDFVLQYVPVQESEKDLRAKFASIGIGTDKKFDISALPADQQQAFQDGLTDAWNEYNPLQAKIDKGEVVSAQLFGSRQMLGNNYLYRMAGAINGIYGNDQAEAMYPIFRQDSSGATLDGANKYVYRFAPGQLPPVKGFWSITMYRMPESLLVANPINRYLINSPMLPDLKPDADGGYTFYVQQESPGADKESNWLPAPAGPFVLIERLYWPDEAAINGTWKAPLPQKVA